MKLKKGSFKKWKKKKRNLFGSISLVRPLIETTRFDLKKLCQIWNLPIYPDVTNQSLISTRNRIRLQLLPILRFFFNSQVDTIFAQFAQINLQEQDFLSYLTTRLIKDLFSKKKILQNKTLSSFENFSYRQMLYFCKIKTKEKLVKLKETKSCQGNTFCKIKYKEDPHFTKAKQRKTNSYKAKVNLYKRANSKFLLGKNQFLRNQTSFHLLYKFEFQNQPLFFIPVAIQKRIGKNLIEHFLNKKVNFFHVEHIIKYLKDSQNLV